MGFDENKKNLEYDQIMVLSFKASLGSVTSLTGHTTACITNTVKSCSVSLRPVYLSGFLVLFFFNPVMPPNSKKKGTCIFMVA